MHEAVVPALAGAYCHIADSDVKLTVVPAQAGTQRLLQTLDSRLRGSDEAVRAFGSCRKTHVGLNSAAPSDVCHCDNQTLLRMTAAPYPTYAKSRSHWTSSDTLSANIHRSHLSRTATRTAILQAALQAGAPK